MPVYNTMHLLDALHTHTDSFLEKAIQEWQSLPDSVLQQQPAPGKWSANQCLLHLNTYGRYYLPQLEKAITSARQNKKPSRPTFRAGWLGNHFTNMMLTKPNGVPAKKMSAPKSANPQSQQNNEPALAEFIEQQERLLKLLEAAREVGLESVRIPISIAPFIMLKLGDTFLFLVAHNYRHLQQAIRALETDFVNSKKLTHFDTKNI